jgi:hypothetical protein
MVGMEQQRLRLTVEMAVQAVGDEDIQEPNLGAQAPLGRGLLEVPVSMARILLAAVVVVVRLKSAHKEMVSAAVKVVTV